VTLHGLPAWRACAAAATGALAGLSRFALINGRGVIMFALVKVDACVVVTPAGDREHVFVALKPARFAPLFQDVSTAPPRARSVHMRWLPWICLVVLLMACRQSSTDEARQLVERYIAWSPKPIAAAM